MATSTAPPERESAPVSGPTVSSPASLLRYIWMSLGTSLSIQAINLISGVITARLLGPSGKGELAAVILWPGLLASIGYLGMTDAATYFTAREPGRQRAIFGTGLTVALIQSVLLLAVGYVLLPIPLGHYGGEVVDTARMYLWWIPLNILTLYAAGMLAGELRFAAFNVLRFTVIATMLLGVLGLALLGAVSVRNIALVYLAANTTALVMAAGLCARANWIGWSLDRRLLVQMLVYGLKSHTASLSLLVNERGDQALISAFLPASQLGLYAVATSLTAPAGLVGSSVSVVVMPSVARAAERGTKLKMAARFARMTVLASTLAAAVLFVATPYIVSVFFGAAFSPAVDVARLLLIGAVVFNTNGALSGALRGFGYPLVTGVAEFVALFVTVGGLLVLLPALGLIGAGVTSILAYAASLICVLLFIRFHLGGRIREFLWPRVSDAQVVLRLVRAMCPARP